MNISKYLNKFIKDYQHFDVEAFIDVDAEDVSSFYLAKIYRTTRLQYHTISNHIQMVGTIHTVQYEQLHGPSSQKQNTISLLHHHRIHHGLGKQQVIYIAVLRPKWLDERMALHRPRIIRVSV